MALDHPARADDGAGQACDLHDLDALRVPMLVLIGEKDTAQREQAELLSTRVPGARLVVIAGGGHLLNLTSPQEFRAEVSRFLR